MDDKAALRAYFLGLGLGVRDLTLDAQRAYEALVKLAKR